MDEAPASIQLSIFLDKTWDKTFLRIGLESLFHDSADCKSSSYVMAVRNATENA